MRLKPVSRQQPSHNYVLDLGYSPAGFHLSAALSTDAVHLFSVGAEGALKAVDAFPDQQGFVTQLGFPSAEQPHHLFVATSGGLLQSYDLASGQQVEGYASLVAYLSVPQPSGLSQLACSCCTFQVQVEIGGRS